MPGTNANKPTDLAVKYGLGETTRWVDFSPYGMSMKLCVFKDAKALVMENGDKHPEIVEALGFVKVGGEWIREDVSMQPREFIKIATDAVMKREMPINDMLIERDEFVLPLFTDETALARKSAFSSRVSAVVSKDKGTDLASMLGGPETTRWMDFSAYGMSLKRCVYADGQVLVMEGGDSNPELVQALGFVKTGDEWVRDQIEFRPIAFRAIATEAVVDRYTPTRDVVVDRRGMNRPVTHWFASFETGGNEVQAFGATPEAAVKALADAWDGLAENERIDRGLLGKFRGGISVVPFVSGKAYAKGIGDRDWYKGGLNGDDERFDDLLPAPTRELGATPEYL
ncbi:hypothetical protein [Rhizobium sp. BK176]|uniref:hypothetical protein n=1 Tax=Rhizobium sp. BK176 TaxID=2587071 RepID=UPI002167C2A6|nr:hypothetical protein [Rhizobium sp. BK176]MCS4089827.1 hypothetical protein [Rhizobium sp. BK176]